MSSWSPFRYQYNPTIFHELYDGITRWTSEPAKNSIHHFYDLGGMMFLSFPDLVAYVLHMFVSQIYDVLVIDDEHKKKYSKC